MSIGNRQYPKRKSTGDCDRGLFAVESEERDANGPQPIPNGTAMICQKNEELRNFDVFPKVFEVGKPATIHIRALGVRTEFHPGAAYRVQVCALEQGNPWCFPGSSSYVDCAAECDDEGTIHFRHAFPSEQMYYLRVFEKDGKNRLVQLAVYAVAEDLAERIPLIGDLHMHTTKSDGRETPEVVCANYRGHGYDFMVISDHKTYVSSLQAIHSYQDVPTGLEIVCGEEIHLPAIDGMENVHVVNFGGEYSVNGLIENHQGWDTLGNDPSVRSLHGKCPPTTTKAEFEAKIREIAAGLDVPPGLDAIPTAMTKFALDETRKAGGLAIYAHPTWISDVYHAPEALTAYVTKNRMFDAFEVLGGERYYEQNGFQTLKYYEDRGNGIDYPIVGSTDSHCSYAASDKALVCSTMVFAPANERTSLIRSIKDFYSVAIDTISSEFRLVGKVRLCRYACFLLQYFFPLHDELCFEEGRLMKQFATGTAEEKKDALDGLTFIRGRMAKLRAKYFAR